MLVPVKTWHAAISKKSCFYKVGFPFYPIGRVGGSCPVSYKSHLCLLDLIIAFINPIINCICIEIDKFRCCIWI